MNKIKLTYILLTVETVTLFYLYQLKADTIGALQYPQAVGSIALAMLATLLLLASETIPSPKKKKKSRKK